MQYKSLFFIFLNFIIFLNINGNTLENKILFKIDNKIITSVDIEGTTEDEDGTHMGVSYNVNDDVSVGYIRQETDFSGTKSDEEHSGFQASYSMGSISFSGRVGKVDNMGGTSGSSDEDKHVTMSVAF